MWADNAGGGELCESDKREGLRKEETSCLETKKSKLSCLPRETAGCRGGIPG